VVDRIVTSPRDRRGTILDVIRGARRRLSLSLFRCNDEEVFEELGRAVARGVEVEVLTTARVKGGRKRLEKLWKALAQTGATVHPYADPVVKYHAKYLVADDGPAVVASLNFTRKCFNRTWDALVVTYDPEVVSSLHRLLAADRDSQPLPEPFSPRLILGPERARRQFNRLMADAKESIRLIDAKLSDPDLVTLLNRRRADGVRVEIFGAKRVGDLKSHGKIMLIDRRIAVVGSLALAALSLEFRREVAITVEEPEAVTEVEQLFNSLPTIVSPVDRVADDSRGEALC
jgi:cardiolipin synthase A/B